MQNVYMIQIPMQFNSDLNNTTTLPVYFPYSIGLLWAYANKFEAVRQNYKLSELIFLKESHEQIVDRLVDPSVIGVSCYIWNMNYTMLLTKKIKQRFPKCKIIAGGPSVPVEDDNFFNDHPYIDILSYREGEISFSDILLALAGQKDLHEVAGIAYNQNEILIRTTPPVRVENLDDIPSPYLSGLFDNLVTQCQQKGFNYNTLFESNRGCPFKCTFCDWGNGTLGKVKKFDLRRVKKELLWMAKNQVEYISNCDANFGAFRERDLAITKFLIKLKRRYGYPKMFDTNWHKNNNSSTVELAKMLMDAGLLRKFTSSIQSMNDGVLKAIKRKNLSDENIKHIVNFARSKGLQTQTELIIALPEETYESFQDAFVSVIETGMLPSASPLVILPNSEMSNKHYRETYGLKTKMFSKAFTYTDEAEELVIETNTMSTTEYQRLVLWVWLIQQFHFHGYTNLIYDYFHRRQGWNIKTFYENLLSLLLQQKNLEPNRVFAPYRNHVEDGLSNQLTLGSINYDLHNHIHIHRREFYAGLTQLVGELPGMDPAVLNDLMLLQNYIQADLDREQAEIIKLNTNLYDYIYNNQPLVHVPTNYLVEHQRINLEKFGTFGAYLVQSRFAQGWKSNISACDTNSDYDVPENQLSVLH